MGQPGTPPPVKKRRFFNDPTPNVKKIARSPTPKQTIDAAQALETNGLSSNLVAPVAEGPTNESGTEEDGFDTALFTSIIGEKLPTAAVTRLRQVSGGNMERGTSSPT